MDLSLKQKTFSRYSSRFLKSTLNFGHFQKKKKKKKKESYSDVFPKLRTPKDGAR